MNAPAGPALPTGPIQPSGPGAARRSAAAVVDLASNGHHAAGVDLHPVPTWAFLVTALAALALFAAVLFRMMPPPLRRRSPGVKVGVVTIALTAGALTHRDSRSFLWGVTVFALAVALPLLWMGRLPADMPSAQDPSARQHPRYPQFARRGCIAALVMVAMLASAIPLTLVFVHGI